ncbi:hypothetical protein K0T92_06215 [Paenibacillus oenotherae]|uniref:Uncharacterized protein n=1 Tax=Paenibacillus oenotherae TaxID=1435645 RepID=A0ABS7D335_9BACL|nr:hypothetical protein [Paenibacillus oenotherae]MBW7474332.1 hypothetical protein [Paenibacillus oenotherae]
MRKWITILYTGLFLIVASTPAASAAQPGSSPPPAADRTEVQQQVQVWIDALSKQPQFESWKKASWNIVSIGPGLHGWLVTLHQNNKPVGYMIVNATEDGGFALGEYGIGGHPAYDPDILYQSLVRQGFFESYAAAASQKLKLERNYIHPLQAVWKWVTPEGETYFLDAWTAEMLPIDEKQWEQQTGKLSIPQPKSNKAALIRTLSAARTNMAFDPYERMPWLTKPPLTKDQVKQLPSLLDRKSEVRYTAELYNENVLFVWPAIGYHLWNNETLFVAFDQQGTRYVPLETIAADGSFYY